MPRKVLVCDNEPALRVLVRATLGDAYTVVEARDGAEAVELLKREQPDVVLLDLMMPKKTGLEVLAEIARDRPRPRVVTLTARTRAADRAAAERAGADRFLTKPFSPLTLIATIDELLMEAQ